jgi:uncharacterized protein (DUF1778 family)
LESETIDSVIPESQEHILHSAASILRHDIQSFVINNEDYPNANEVSLSISDVLSQSALTLILTYPLQQYHHLLLSTS